MVEFLVAKADDWVGIYVNGNLIAEGHQIDMTRAMRLVAEWQAPLTIVDRWVNLDWIHDMGSLPASVADVVWQDQTYSPTIDYDEEP